MVTTTEQLHRPGLLSWAGRGWWVLLVYGIFGVIFGVFAIARPLAAAIALAWAVGALALAEGVVSLFALFDKNVTASRGWRLFYAITSIMFGVLTVINPVITAGVLLLLLAVWLVIAGVFRIVLAIQVRREIKGEWLLALSGVLSIVLGVLFAISPLTGLVVTSLWIGIGALFYGVLQILAAFKLRKLRTA